jgi:uncharacterized protein YndB with AHSA1/START domain
MPEYKGQAATTIQAPVERVYAYLADFTKHSEWAKNISKVTQVTPGPITVGTVFKTQEGAPPVRLGQKVKMMASFMQGIFGGAKPYSEAKITALESPRRIAWQAGIPKGDGFFNFAEWEFALEPQGNATHLTQRFHWKPQNPTAERMVAAAGVEGLEHAVAVNLARLKRRLEVSAGEP